MLNYPVAAEKLISLPPESFESAALSIFRYQYEHNAVYRQYVDTLGINTNNILSITAIPFLPVSFFKSHDVITEKAPPQAIFYSSGTTGSSSSRHMVADLSLYDLLLTEGFRRAYGPPLEWTILCLLPSYLEREGSSLVYMAEKLIRASEDPDSGFFLYDHEALAGKLLSCNNSGKKTLLLGVTYALLDFAEKYPMHLSHTVIMETGGMKGRRKEMVREEVHTLLSQAFGLEHIHSEYGMTEMLSQAYSQGEGVFNCPPWLKILAGDVYDPLDCRVSGKGKLKVIDLANMFSCSFIATDDLGEVYENGNFIVSGRADGSETRGCNLMVSSL